MKLISIRSISKNSLYKRNRKNMIPKYRMAYNLYLFRQHVSTDLWATLYIQSLVINCFLTLCRATLCCQEWRQYYTDREGNDAVSVVQLSGSHLREMIVVTLVSWDKAITVSGSASGGRAACGGQRWYSRLQRQAVLRRQGPGTERDNEKLGVRVEGQEGWKLCYSEG